MKETAKKTAKKTTKQKIHRSSLVFASRDTIPFSELRYIFYRNNPQWRECRHLPEKPKELTVDFAWFINGLLNNLLITEASANNATA